VKLHVHADVTIVGKTRQVSLDEVQSITFYGSTAGSPDCTCFTTQPCTVMNANRLSGLSGAQGKAARPCPARRLIEDGCVQGSPS
jgi:hypothetical protein